MFYPKNEYLYSWDILDLAVLILATEAYIVVIFTSNYIFNKQNTHTGRASGYRNNGSGSLNNIGSNGNYWSSAPNSQTNARNLNFNSGNVNPLNNNNRSNGFAVRPLRELGKFSGVCYFTNEVYFSRIALPSYKSIFKS